MCKGCKEIMMTASEHIQGIMSAALVYVHKVWSEAEAEAKAVADANAMAEADS